MLSAKIQHLLCLPDSADDRTRELPPPEQQATYSQRQRIRRRPYQRQRSVELEQIKIGIQVVFAGNRVEDEVEAARVLLHLRFILRDHDFVSAQTQRVCGLVWGSREEHGVSPESMGELQSHVT